MLAGWKGKVVVALALLLTLVTVPAAGAATTSQQTSEAAASVCYWSASTYVNEATNRAAGRYGAAVTYQIGRGCTGQPILIKFTRLAVSYDYTGRVTGTNFIGWRNLDRRSDNVTVWRQEGEADRCNPNPSGCHMHWAATPNITLSFQSYILRVSCACHPYGFAGRTVIHYDPLADRLVLS